MTFVQRMKRAWYSTAFDHNAPAQFGVTSIMRQSHNGCKFAILAIDLTGKATRLQTEKTTVHEIQLLLQSYLGNPFSCVKCAACTLPRAVSSPRVCICLETAAGGCI